MSMASYDPCVNTEGSLTEEDRRKIVARIHSLLFWVGKLIPEHLQVNDRQLPLRDVVYHYIENDRPSEEQKGDALALASMLEKRADTLEEEIKHDPKLTRQDACEMMNEVTGLLRAVDEIRTADSETAKVKSRALMSRVEDTRRWHKFLKEVR